jgi:carboxypeptidase Q
MGAAAFRRGRGAGLALLALALLTLASSSARAQETGSAVEAYRPVADRILAAAAGDRAAWDRLAELTDTFGPRLSGSQSLENALRWAEARMKEDGFENVRLEPVMVPHWVRGRESLDLLRPASAMGPLVVLGLGNSVGTAPSGIEGEVVIVKSFDDLEAKGAAGVKDRIVLFNVPYTSYGETVPYRGTGASRAAKLGARAMLLRSVGPTGLRTPHTGALRYDEGQPRIPAAAIPAEDAERLQRLADRGLPLRVRLKMEARFLPDAPSANLVGEIVGREKPDEIVLVGGHLDSWDVGMGAMDDGGGCIVTWEALRLMKKLGLRPRRTVRVVLFTNEENGLRGAQAYLERHAAEATKHVLALESDGGVFSPKGFGFSGSEAARAIVREVAALLAPIGATEVAAQGGGADIGPLVRAGRVPAMSLDADGARYFIYFIYHHTAADTVERLDPAEMSRCAAAVAVMAYVAADLPEALPRESGPVTPAPPPRSR